MKKHDLVDGTQSKCQICGNQDLQLVVDLGTQPLADKLQKINGELNEEISYPLVQMWCQKCGLNQLNFICPSQIMFGDDYSYKTGVTKELVLYQAQMAADLVQDLNLTDQDLVCDLGSNDGTLLKGFMKQGVEVIGVEPTDIADLANHGWCTYSTDAFWRRCSKFCGVPSRKSNSCYGNKCICSCTTTWRFYEGSRYYFKR